MILRALFGIGMGGEWGVGASLAMEKAPKGRRGFLSGLLQEGYATGQLLAALCYLFVFPHVGWRAMFFIGGLPAFLAIYIRMNVKESEVWQKVKVDNWAHLGRAILSHWRTFLAMFAMMTAMGLVSHGTQDMYPNFLKEYHHYSPTMVAYITICYSIGAILGGLVMGHLSDTIGRKRAMVISLLLACLAVPLWAYAQSLPLLILGAFVLQFMVQGAWGIVPAHVNELSPDSVRGFLPGFAYQCGIAVAGMITVVQSTLADRMDYAHAMAIAAVAVFLIGAIAVSLGKEKHAIEFGGG
jgi:SHS family lactate transporter-like MFS transporter